MCSPGQSCTVKGNCARGPLVIQPILKGREKAGVLLFAETLIDGVHRLYDLGALIFAFLRGVIALNHSGLMKRETHFPLSYTERSRRPPNSPCECCTIIGCCWRRAVSFFIGLG